MAIIGRGTFTNVITDPEDQKSVRIITVDDTKGSYVYGRSALFPLLTYEDTIDAPKRLRNIRTYARVYKADRLDKLTRLDQIKDDREKWLFKELCKIKFAVGCSSIFKMFERLGEFTGELQGMAGHVADWAYGPEHLAFECSKRNAMIKGGRLVLSDIFFCYDQFQTRF